MGWLEPGDEVDVGLVWIWLCLACGEVEERGVLETQLAPRVVARTLTGGSLSLQAQQPKPVLLVFWASWCLPCRKEVPQLHALMDQYGDSISVIGVNMGEPVGKAQAAATEMGMRYPSLLDTDGAIASNWRVRTLPLGIILDGDGRIRFRGNGLPHQPTVLLDGLVGSP